MFPSFGQFYWSTLLCFLFSLWKGKSNIWKNTATVPGRLVSRNTQNKIRISEWIKSPLPQLPNEQWTLSDTRVVSVPKWFHDQFVQLFFSSTPKLWMNSISLSNLFIQRTSSINPKSEIRVRTWHDSLQCEWRNTGTIWRGEEDGITRICWSMNTWTTLGGKGRMTSPSPGVHITDNTTTNHYWTDHGACRTRGRRGKRGRAGDCICLPSHRWLVSG